MRETILEEKMFLPTIQKNVIFLTKPVFDVNKGFCEEKT
jgi:hypothetical protein